MRSSACSVQAWLKNARTVLAVKCVRCGGATSCCGYTEENGSPQGLHARVQGKVRGHLPVVCGYINVCSDLRRESGLCSSTSGRQIDADRQARPHCCETRLQKPPFFSICCAVTSSPSSFSPSVCFSFCLAHTPPCSPSLLHTLFLPFLRAILHKPKSRGLVLTNQCCVFASEQMFLFHADFQSSNGGAASVEWRKRKARGQTLL